MTTIDWFNESRRYGYASFEEAVAAFQTVVPLMAQVPPRVLQAKEAEGFVIVKPWEMIEAKILWGTNHGAPAITITVCSKAVLMIPAE